MDDDMPDREPRNFMSCVICGQTIDMRSIAQTVHHNKPEHVPLTNAELADLEGPSLQR
jgi:hypothetical protein